MGLSMHSRPVGGTGGPWDSRLACEVGVVLGSVLTPDRVRTESNPQTPGGCPESWRIRRCWKNIMHLMLEALVVKHVVS